MNNKISSFFDGRIQNFLQFKKINNFQNISPQTSSESLTTIRDIEEKQPFPIGFIGPIESLFQWSSMIISALPEFSQEILNPIFEEIIEKVEDEYFLMGPTFTVADCILASDLKNIENLVIKNSTKKILLPSEIKNYIQRVEEFIL